MKFNKNRTDEQKREVDLLDQLATFHFHFLIQTYHEITPFDPDEVAQLSYEYAEKMIKERRNSLTSLGL